jgi:MFS family permease
MAIRRICQKTSRSGSVAFVVAMAMSGAGVTISLLAATALENETNGGAHGALWAGAFLIILFVTKAGAIWAMPTWSVRVAPERLFLLTTILLIVAWGGAGILIVLDAPATAIILAVAPVDGIANGVFAVETPLLSSEYFSEQSFATAHARVSFVWGIACALGAIGAGLLIDGAGAGWALVARAALSIPMLLVAVRLVRFRTRVIPHFEMHDASVASVNQSREARRLLADPAVRRVVLLAVILTAVTAPVIVMIVPIGESLLHTSNVLGASIVLSAMSVGSLLAPAFVRLFDRRMSTGRDPILAAFVASGLLLAAFGVASIFLTSRTQLFALAAVGLVFGGAEFGSQSTVLGQVVRVSGSSSARQAISTMKFSTSLAAPLGILAWEILLDTTSGVTAMFVSAVAVIIVAFSFSRLRSFQVV